MSVHWGNDGSARSGVRRRLREARERDRRLTMRHRWYAGGIATLLSGALIFTGVTPALAEVVPPPADQTSTEPAPPLEDAPPAEETPIEQVPSEQAPVPSEPAPAPSEPATETPVTKPPVDDTKVDEPQVDQPQSRIAPQADVAPLAVLPGCTGSCLTITRSVTISGGGPASASDWEYRATTGADWAVIPSGATGVDVANGSYAVSALSLNGDTADYVTTVSCTDAGSGLSWNGGSSTLSYTSGSDRASTCTFTHTFQAPGTITIQKGGLRTGGQTIAGLAGATFVVYKGGDGSAPDPTPANQVGTCVTAANGQCSVSVPSGQQYWILETAAPSGWSSVDQLYVGGSSGSQANTPYRFRTGTIAADTNTTYPQVGTGSGATASSGYWADVLNNPTALQACGIRVGLLIDLSNSIDGAELTQLKTAATGFVDALQGTPSSLALWTFATSAPASGGANGKLNLTSVSTAGGATTVKNKINGLTQPGGEAGATNWDQGLWQVANDAANKVDVLLMLTDGTPTVYGPSADGPGDYSRFREVETSVFSANAVKNLGTRVVPVGIGVGSAEANIKAISGPAINSDYFLVANYAALATFLQNLAKGQCESTINVTKMVVPAGGTIANAMPTQGWGFSAASGNTVTPGAGSTNASGAISFKVGGLSSGQSAAVTITEEDREGYTLLEQAGKNAVCKNDLDQSVTVTDAGALGFTANATGGRIVTCTVYNQAPNPQVELKVIKKWVINGTTYDNDAPGRPFGSAQLKLDGQNAVFGNEYTYNVGTNVAISETVSGLPPFCTNVSSGTGTHTVTASPKPNVVTVTNTVTCTTKLTLSKKVVGGEAAPSSWTLTGSGPGGALTGPTGSAPTSLTNVTPGARYVLSETGGDPRYTQEVVPNAVPVPGSTGSWHCYVLNADGTRGSEGAGGLNGWVEVQLGQHVDCEAINQTASLVLLKQVVNDDGGTQPPSAWDLTATPAVLTGLTATTVDGSATAGPANTIQVRPGHTYTVSETGPTGYQQVKLQQLVGGNWVDVAGWDVSVPANATGSYRIVNDDVAPKLTLVKRVTNDNGGTALNTAWTLTATSSDGPNLSGPTGTTGDVEANAVYTLAEANGPLGYDWTTLSCTGYPNTTKAAPTLTLKPGDDVTCTFTNDDIEVPVGVVKADGVVKQLDGGNWEIRYRVTVTNTSTDLPATYSLTDTPQFEASFEILSEGWEGNPDVTDAVLEAGGSDSYIYVVVARSTKDPVDASALVCTENGGGFFNVATVTFPGGADTDSGCAVPAKPAVNKIALPSTQDPVTGAWTLRYAVSVTNASGIDLWYSATDTPTPLPAGAVGGAWQVLAPTLSGGGTAVVNPLWDGGAILDLATGQIPNGATHTYTITRTVQIPASVDDDLLDCLGEGVGLWNATVVTNGIGGNEAEACAQVDRPDVTIDKSVTGTAQRADGTWDITYEVVVTNESTELAAVYDLDDSLLYGGDIEILDAAWTGPTGGAAFAAPTWSATLATGQVLAPRVGDAGVDTYSVTVHADVDAAAWAGETLECQDGEVPGAGGFLNTATVTVNGEEITDDACEEPNLPTFQKVGTAATQDPDDATKWLVSYELRATTGGFDTFYSLSDTPVFAPGITPLSATAQRIDTDPDGPQVPVTAGADFVTNVPLGAADAPHVYTITWLVDITGTFDPDTAACDGEGSGFFNTAMLSIGEIEIPGDACIPVEDAVYPVPAKTVTSTTQDPETGDWTVVYDIDVTLAPEGPENPEGLSAEYDLTDTLEFGGDIEIGSASWEFEGTSNDFPGPDDPATLADDRTIDAGETHTYTVTVVAAVTEQAIDDGTTACPSGEETAGGFLNTALLTSGQQETPVDACAEPVFPEIEKHGGVTIDNGDGTFDIEYFVTVTYPESELEPLPESVAYDLTDAPVLPAGVELDGDWTAEAADDATPDPTDTTWDGTGTWTVVDDGELTPEDDVHTYRVFATVEVTAPPTGEPQTCDETEGQGILILNVGTITSGDYVADDDGCQVVHFDDVGIEKTAVLAEGEESVEPGDEYSYELTVTNYGTRPAENVRVTDDDLNDRLDILGLTVSPAEVTWHTAPGWTENGEDQSNDVVDLTLDVLGVGESAVITIDVEFLAYEQEPVLYDHDGNPETPGIEGLPPLVGDEGLPAIPEPIDVLENTACVSLEGADPQLAAQALAEAVALAGDGNPENDCDSAEVPARDVVALVYTRCVNDAPFLGWAVTRSALLQSSPIDFRWEPNNADVTPETTPPFVADQFTGTGVWAEEISWPGSVFTPPPSSISIDYPGWRAIEASDIVPGSIPTQYYLPGTNVVMTPAQQADYVFNGLILDPSELDFAWRGVTDITFSVNPTLEFSTAYPPATPECFVARHTEVQVEKTASVERTEPGASFSYTLDVVNVSEDSAAEGVVVTDAIPADIKITQVNWTGKADADAFPNWQSCEVTGQNGAGYGGTLECVLYGPLQPINSDNGGASVAPRITLSATVNPQSSANTITNVAVVDYHTFGDPDDPGRDSDDATILLSTLPATGGGPLVPLLMLGFLALLAGVTAVVVTRRRRGEVKPTL